MVTGVATLVVAGVGGEVDVEEGTTLLVRDVVTRAGLDVVGWVSVEVEDG